MIQNQLIQVEIEMTICQCEVLVWLDQKVTTDLLRNLDGAKSQTNLHQQDVALEKIVIAEKTIKVAQILDDHMEMTKKMTQLLAVDDSAPDSLDHMMMMKLKHINPNASRL